MLMGFYELFFTFFNKIKIRKMSNPFVATYNNFVASMGFNKKMAGKYCTGIFVVKSIEGKGLLF